MNSPAGLTTQERAACEFVRARFAAVHTRLSPEVSTLEIPDRGAATFRRRLAPSPVLSAAPPLQ